MTGEHRYWGAALYLKVAPEACERFVRVALLETLGRIGDIQLRFVQMMPAGSDRASRVRPLKASVFDELLAQSVAGTVASILAFDRKTSLATASDTPVVLLELGVLPDHDGLQDVSLLVPS